MRSSGHSIRSVAVVGLGFVGLPLAMAFAGKGFRVMGIDIDAEKIESLNGGQSYLADVPNDVLADMMAKERFFPTYRFDRVGEMDAIILCVPTPLKKREPDLSYIMSAVEFILPHLRRGQLVVLESSTYPGTTDEYIAKRIEDRGFVIGRDMFLGYSPERIDPGNVLYSLEDIPKIISGMTKACLEKVSELYGAVFRQTVPVSSTRMAEFVKLMENSQRMINISFINELNMLARKLNLDIWEAIEAAKTKPMGFQPYYPSAGIGGHCIPVDPFYLSWIGMREGVPLSMINQAGIINDTMPHFVVGATCAELPRLTNGKRPAVGVVGLTYKKDVNDIRESASLKVIRLLQMRNIDVYVHDPVYRGPLPERTSPFAIEEPDMSRLDATLILVDHSGVDWEKLVALSRKVIDTRNATSGISSRKIVRL